MDTTLSRRASGKPSKHGRCACVAQALSLMRNRSKPDEHIAGRCELTLNTQPSSTHRRCGPLRNHLCNTASVVRLYSSASAADARCCRCQQAIARAPHAEARQLCTLPGSLTGHALKTSQLNHTQNTRRVCAALEVCAVPALCGTGSMRWDPHDEAPPLTHSQTNCIIRLYNLSAAKAEHCRKKQNTVDLRAQIERCAMATEDAPPAAEAPETAPPAEADSDAGPAPALQSTATPHPCGRPSGRLGPMSRCTRRPSTSSRRGLR